MSAVDTGQSTPPVDIPGASMPGAPPGMPTQIPGQPIHRPSFLQAFLANLGPSLAGGLPAYGPQGEQNFGTGLAGGLGGIQSYEQKQFERAQQIQQ